MANPNPIVSGPWTWDARQNKWVPTPSPAAPRRFWWISGEGIVRQIIQGNIQAYLGPDATCKPYSRGGVLGYAIYASRTFTSEQLRDLQHESQEYAVKYGWTVAGLNSQQLPTLPPFPEEQASLQIDSTHDEDDAIEDVDPTTPARPRPKPTPTALPPTASYQGSNYSGQQRDQVYPPTAYGHQQQGYPYNQ